MESKEEFTMRKYVKPSIEVVELSVKESLSAIPFAKIGAKKLTVNGKANSIVTIYKKTSVTEA